MINWQDIEDLGFEAEQLASLALTLEDAVSYGPASAAEYFGAFSILTTIARRHADKLNVMAKAEISKLRE